MYSKIWLSAGLKYSWKLNESIEKILNMLRVTEVIHHNYPTSDILKHINTFLSNYSLAYEYVSVKGNPSLWERKTVQTQEVICLTMISTYIRQKSLEEEEEENLHDCFSERCYFSVLPELEF